VSKENTTAPRAKNREKPSEIRQLAPSGGDQERRNDNCDYPVMRRAFDSALLSAGAAVILLLVLVAVDPNVRTQVWRQAATSPAVHLTDASQQAGHAAHVIVQAVRDQSFANAPMLIFGAAAAVLVMFMLRT
jgi:hypothetical protein